MLCVILTELKDTPEFNIKLKTLQLISFVFLIKRVINLIVIVPVYINQKGRRLSDLFQPFMCYVSVARSAIGSMPGCDHLVSC